MKTLYQWLLRLYPLQFREQFGDEMSLVFAEVNAVDRPFAGQVRFAAREISGMLCGACMERVRPILGDSFVSRRIVMKTPRSLFRFPVAAITFMTLSLGLVVLTIHNAREISNSFAAKAHVFQGTVYSYEPSRLSFLQTFGFAFGVTVVFAVAVWAVLHLLHRSGVERLSEIQTWPQQ